MPIPKQKAKEFAKIYVKKGMKGTQAIKELEPDLENRPDYARLKAHRYVNSPITQQFIKEILEEKGLTPELVAGILKRNIVQDKQIAGSNQGIDLYNKMTGIYEDKPTQDQPIFNIVVKELNIEKPQEISEPLQGNEEERPV